MKSASPLERGRASAIPLIQQRRHRMPHYIAVIAGVASLFVLVACGTDPPNLQATKASAFWREATVVAKTVRSIEATRVAQERRDFCLLYPLRCGSVGLNAQSVRRACLATAEANPTVRRSSCDSALTRQLLTPQPTPAMIQPIPRLAPRVPRPSVPRPSVPTVTVPRPGDYINR